MEISKSRVKLYASLQHKKHRNSTGLFVAEGTKCIEETLGHFDLEALVALPSWIDARRELTDTLPTDQIFEATPLRMEQLSGMSTAPQAVAVYRKPASVAPSDSDISDGLILVLDGVQDPGNLGTIMRIADWFGIRHIVASPETADIYNPKTVQATMGAIARVNVFYTPLVPFLKCHPAIPCFGTLLDGDDIYKAEIPLSGFLIMGNEGNGISPEVRALVTHRLRIPSYPPDGDTVESLNVAMATAIAVAEFRRRLINR